MLSELLRAAGMVCQMPQDEAKKKARSERGPFG